MLMFVEVSLNREQDNAQRIFESMNSTGLDLSQADLIRNYILMNLSSHQQEVIYKKYWEIIEKATKQNDVNRLPEFIRDFLTYKTLFGCNTVSVPDLIIFVFLVYVGEYA